jgi:hypothetical protein
MFQQRSDRPTTACNDNGSFFRRRGHVAPLASGFLHTASEAAGPICLNYVAPGVFLISCQEPASLPVRRRRAPAA